MKVIEADLDRLSSRLRHAQLDYEFARSRGDSERLSRSKLEMSAIVAERDRLATRLAQDRPSTLH